MAHDNTSPAHTHLPWRLSEDCTSVLADTKNGGVIEITRMNSGLNELSAAETMANARLIATAPELLEAVQACLNSLIDKPINVLTVQDSLSCFLAHSAIAKAKGKELRRAV